MTPGEALRRIQDACARGRYFVDPHAADRMATRTVTVADIKHLARKPASIAPHPGRTTPARTSSWRLTGEDLHGKALMVGIDLTVDHLGNFALVATVM